MKVPKGKEGEEQQISFESNCLFIVVSYIFHVRIRQVKVKKATHHTQRTKCTSTSHKTCIHITQSTHTSHQTHTSHRKTQGKHTVEREERVRRER
jgi:hypothetical protein